MENKTYAPVKDESHLYRIDHGIINTDDKTRVSLRNQRRREQNIQNLIHRASEINMLKSDIAELKVAINQLFALLKKDRP